MPPTGWIEPINRNKAQETAHFAARASSAFVRHALVPQSLAPGQSVKLYSLFDNPDVISDVGFKYARWWQHTGSCVKCGAFNAAVCTIAAQRVAGENPTKAFMPFLWHNYAMSRHYMGDDGEGEGSMGSTMAKSLHGDGIRDYPVDKSDALPDYRGDMESGFNITEQEEYDWSSIRNKNVAKVLEVSKAHLFGVSTEANSPADVLALIQNGYGVTFACNNYIGSANIKGSGENAVLLGRMDTRGGHQTAITAVWNHPQFGLLFLIQGSWPESIYPRDPAGAPICAVWCLEKDLDSAMRTLDAEVYGIGSLSWFPSQPRILDWVM